MIATNRIQHVSFYNTTGLIEKDKNIYFVPRFSKGDISEGTLVSIAWLNMFNAIKTSPSEFTDIQISQWSPDDRTLTVKGNVDDFRKGGIEGQGLNYFIVERRVFSTPQIYTTYYYAYFITNARQTGSNTVQLEYVPDDFTNVFYLHNTHALIASEISSDYEPFNEKMKNCYIERQHYNRVKIDSNNRIIPDNLNVFLNTEEQYKYRYQFRDLKTPIMFDRGAGFNEIFSVSEIATIKETNSFWNLNSSIRTRILRCCLYYGKVLLKERLTIKNVYSTMVSFSPYRDNPYRGYVDNSGNISSALATMYFPTFVIPEFLSKYKNDIEATEFRNSLIYEDSLGGTHTVIRPTNLTTKVMSLRELTTLFSTQSWGDYVLAIYVVKEPQISASIATTTNASSITWYLKVFTNRYPDTSEDAVVQKPLDKGQWASFIPNSLNVFSYNPPAREYYGYLLGYQSQYFSGDYNLYIGNYDANRAFEDWSVMFGIGITLSQPENAYEGKIKLTTTLNNATYYKSNYFDNILESDPYQFYSISYNSNEELVLPRNRYYSSMTSDSGSIYDWVDFKYIQSDSEALKLSIIPVYTVENVAQPYFNESLTITITSSLPIMSDSYYSYYYQNKAQMKNQYAVNTVGMVEGMATGSLDFVTNQAKGKLFGANWVQMLNVGAGVGLFGNLLSYGVKQATTAMNQQAKLSDMGKKPDTIKQASSDIFFDLKSGHYGFELNHYKIDELSYNSIAKFLERFGYYVNLYDTLHAVTRVGWDYIKINSFDYEAVITDSEESSIRKIFSEGVTLIHDNSYFTSGHNYEIILE